MEGNKRGLIFFTALLFLSILCILILQREHLLVALQLSFANYSINQLEGFLPENETDDATNRRRVMCMIMTTISNWETRGKAVRNTWAKRCHRTVFFYTKVGDWSSSEVSKEPNAVGLDIPDGRDHLTGKTFRALEYSYKKFALQADYFLKADDDTYVIMENLQRMISKFNSTLLYLGRRIDNLLPKGYNSGGAGYVISREAVKLMLKKRSSLPKDCPKDGAIEDFDIGKCLAKLGIYPVDELDETGRLTFHSDNPLKVLQSNELLKYYRIDFSEVQFGNKEAAKTRGLMLSERTATIHYVTPPEIYMYDFLLYRLRRSGR